MVDEVAYADQEGDISYGRFPNGTGDFQLMQPTPEAKNDGTSSTGETASSAQLRIYPNPVAELLYIETERIGTVRLQVVDVFGRTVAEYELEERLEIPVGNLAAGTYVLVVEGGEVRRFVKR